ncbi:MAG TPA: metallophosphoesterase family protein [Baekduia sp.]|nr:metallophosphoesterase family protein [Baekduia sp.]
MRVAVISDIHGNLQALEAVLADIERADLHDIWCLGDTVGYGADPNDCCQIVRDETQVVLAGNHDLAVAGTLPTDEFSRGAAIAADWTREVLDESHVRWLAGRPSAGEIMDVGLYHASPRNPVWEYVLSALLAELCFDSATQRLSLIGHSHVALSFVRHEGESATGERRRSGEVADLSKGEWLLNPGSVGQPRDGDPRAAWLLLDLDLQRAEWRRTSYDVAKAQQAIRAARLPDSLAERLHYGQ